MLSDAKARKAKPTESDYKLADDRGLYLLVAKSGSKLWRHKYRFAGKEKLASYGPYPEVSIVQARALRDQTRQLVRDGKDPSIEKRKAEALAGAESGHDFESLAREWHQLNHPRWTAKHANDVIHTLERDVFPMLGQFPPDEITAPLIIACLRAVEQRGAIETAHRNRQRISAVLGYGLSLGIVSSNPAEMVKHALKPIVRKGKQPALLDIAELRRVLTVTEASGAYPVTLLASRFLAFTAQRPGNIRCALWENISGVDLNDEADEGANAVWHIPAEQMKLTVERKGDEAFDHVVPLTAPSVDVLRAVRRLTGNCAFIFPSQRHAHIPLSENAIGYLYNRNGFKGRHVPHGWRAAFSSIMNERRRHDRAVIDMMLAHSASNKVEAAYNRAEHLALRRQIAEEWSELLSENLQPAENLLTMARRG